jgi:hypothetical protein
MDANDSAGHPDSQRRFRLLLPNTQRALSRNSIWTDAAMAKLTDRDLLQLAGIGPVGRQDIRQHFPRHDAG